MEARVTLTLLPLMLLLAVAACEDAGPVAPDRAAPELRFSLGQEKLDVCHWREEEKSYVKLSVAEPARSAHLNHGDIPAGTQGFSESCVPPIQAATCPCFTAQGITNLFGSTLVSGANYSSFFTTYYGTTIRYLFDINNGVDQLRAYTIEDASKLAASGFQAAPYCAVNTAQSTVVAGQIGGSTNQAYLTAAEFQQCVAELDAVFAYYGL